jgi:hypothetical protein
VPLPTGQTLHQALDAYLTYIDREYREADGTITDNGKTKQTQVKAMKSYLPDVDLATPPATVEGGTRAWDAGEGKASDLRNDSTFWDGGDPDVGERETDHDRPADSRDNRRWNSLVN